MMSATAAAAAVTIDPADKLFHHIIEGGDAFNMMWSELCVQSYEPPVEDKAKISKLNTSFHQAYHDVYSKQRKMRKEALLRGMLAERLLNVGHSLIFDPLPNGICEWYCLLFFSYVLSRTAIISLECSNEAY
jgi:hypothetical protein